MKTTRKQRHGEADAHYYESQNRNELKIKNLKCSACGGSYDGDGIEDDGLCECCGNR